MQKGQNQIKIDLKQINIVDLALLEFRLGEQGPEFLGCKVMDFST